MCDLYTQTFQKAAIEIAMSGWSRCNVPENLKDWCARDLCSRLPQDVLKELFTRLVTNRQTLASAQISFPSTSVGGGNSNQNNNSPYSNQPSRYQSHKLSQMESQKQQITNFLKGNNGPMPSTSTSNTNTSQPFLQMLNQASNQLRHSNGMQTGKTSRIEPVSNLQIMTSDDDDNGQKHGQGNQQIQVNENKLRDLVEKITKSIKAEESAPVSNTPPNFINQSSFNTPQQANQVEPNSAMHPFIEQLTKRPSASNSPSIDTATSIQDILRQYQSQNTKKRNSNEMDSASTTSSDARAFMSRMQHSPSMSTPQKPVDDKRFFCEKCGKSFKNNAGFKMHLRSHLIKDSKLAGVKSGGNASAATFASTAASLLAHMNDPNAISPSFAQSQGDIANVIRAASQQNRGSSSPGGPKDQLNAALAQLTNNNSFNNSSSSLPGFPTHGNGTVPLSPSQQSNSSGVGSSMNTANGTGPSDIPPETTISQVVGEDGEKRHRCDICGYTSKRYADLRDHQRIHSDERPFQCTICLARFKQRQTLRNHRRNVHKVSGIDNIPCIPVNPDPSATLKFEANQDHMNPLLMNLQRAQQLPSSTQMNPVELLSKLNTNMITVKKEASPESKKPTQSSSLTSLLEQLTNGMMPPPTKKLKGSNSQSEENISDADFRALIGSAAKGAGAPASHTSENSTAPLPVPVTSTAVSDLQVKLALESSAPPAIVTTTLNNVPSGPLKIISQGELKMIDASEMKMINPNDIKIRTVSPLKIVGDTVANTSSTSNDSANVSNGKEGTTSAGSRDGRKESKDDDARSDTNSTNATLTALLDTDKFSVGNLLTPEMDTTPQTS